MELNGAYYCSRCMREMEDDGICPHCGLDNDIIENNASRIILLYERRSKLTRKTMG